jgi:foldase protein PrsA
MFAVLAEPVATVTSPAYSSTISQETLDHWTRFSGTRDEALTFLLRAAWTEGEARERSIVVTQAEIREQAEPDPDRSRADELFMARAQLLSTRIRDQVTQPAAQSVTPEQIEAYVREHPRTDPEERDARVIEARSRPAAKQALEALQRGLTWRSAAKRYGTLRKRTTVKTTPMTRLDRAVLRTDKGETTRYGSFVFRITRITPERPAPADVQRAQAWEILSSEAQRQALAAFETGFTEKWRARTTCPTCGNPPTGE